MIGGIFLLLGTLAASSAPVTFAQTRAGQTVLEGVDVAGEKAGFKKERTDVNSIIANFVNVLISISGIIFLLIVVYGGFLYMTAGGDEAKIKKAKSMLTSGVIGLIIITAAFGISLFVFEKLEAVVSTAAPSA